jgi:ankyrin repeat protein
MAKQTRAKGKEVPLISAARKGDSKRVRALLNAGAKVDATDAESAEVPSGLSFAYREGGLKNFEESDWNLGRTALMWATRNGHVEIVRLLVESGSDVNAKDKVGLTPLMLAVINGHVELVRILIGAKANMRAKDRNGATPLIFAVETQNSRIVQELLAAGADVNSKSKDGRTPLVIAASNGNAELVEELLKAGADPNAHAKDGPTALGSAMEAKELEKRLRVVRRLLQAGAELNSREDESGSTPLMEALRYGRVELVRVLLDAGADIHRQKDNGVTPLMMASQTGDIEAVQLLLEAGADINRKDESGWTALSNAAIRANPEVVDALIKAGAAIQGPGGQVALRLAANGGHIEIVHRLLAGGVEVNAQDENGWSVLDDVNNQLEIAEHRKDLNKDNLRKVLAILTKAGARHGAKEGEPTGEAAMAAEAQLLPDFGEAARKELRQAVEELSELCGSRPEPLGQIKGGFSFTLAAEKAEEILSKYHADLLKKGYYLFRCVSNHGIGLDSLALLSTADKYRVIEAMQTSGASDMSTDDIIHWLKALEKDQPFELTGIGSDCLEGKFITRVKNSRALAKMMYKFCPDIVDQGTGSVAQLAAELKKSNRLYFWWD